MSDDALDHHFLDRQNRVRTLDSSGCHRGKLRMLKRGGTYEEYGQVTVKGMMHILCSHDQQHLAGMQWLLGRIESDLAFPCA